MGAYANRVKQLVSLCICHFCGHAIANIFSSCSTRLTPSAANYTRSTDASLLLSSIDCLSFPKLQHEVVDKVLLYLDSYISK